MKKCAPVARMGENTNGFVYRNTESVPIMASTMVYGSFENIAGAFLSFANWLQEHYQYKMAGTSRQIIHRGPWNEESPDKYLTEMQVPLVKIVGSNPLKSCMMKARTGFQEGFAMLCGFGVHQVP